MAVEEQSQLSLINTLTNSLINATSALEEGDGHFVPPQNGISLLDVKNDLLLSYLQNLVFLVLLKFRAADSANEDKEAIATRLKQKLTELRVYLERGVRPLESRLKYQIDSALRAAENSKLAAEINKSRDSRFNENEKDGSESERSDDNEDVSGGGAAFTGDLEDGDAAMLYKPNLQIEPLTTQNKLAASRKDSSGTQGRSGVYKPPRVNPTAMPDPDKRNRDSEPRKRKSQLLNEYIDEEMSAAPRAQPSIGSNNTILDRGRVGLSQRDREKERERTEYEEKNFIRLPAQTKKEKREARRKGQLDSRDMFGGEDWTGLGGMGDRVSRSVAASGKDRVGVLQRREKRRATEDMPKGDGLEIGASFEKRRRILEGRAAKKTRKK